MEQVVSVIVPVYNVEKYIDRCVQSIVNQTYPSLQILLVNDGSTDQSVLLLENWAKKDKRIELLHKVNGGLSDARNYGMKQARGEYFAFIDSDDFIKSDMIETMLKVMLQENAQVGVCDMEYLYDDGTIKFASGGDFEQAELSQNPALIRMNNSACNKLFHRDLFNSVEFPVGKWYEDLATIPMVLFNAKKVVKINEPYYVYYQRSGSIAHSTSKKIFHIYEAIARVIDYIEQHCNNEQQKTQFIQEMMHAYILHGLDLTTLRIKDFDQKEEREEYLAKNMEQLNLYYPTWRKDSLLKQFSFKKKLIVALLKRNQWKAVLRIYDRSSAN